MILENIDLKDLNKCWLHNKPYNHAGRDFTVLKVNGAVKEYRLRKSGKEEVVLQYPESKLGFCVVTELIKN